MDITVSKFYFGGISGDINLGMQEKYKYLKKMLPYVYNNEEDTYIFNLFLLSNQRIKYLREIEKNTVIRKLTTLILKILYKIAKMF